MIDLGTYRGKVVTTNDDELTNHHIAVIGSSGSGKTVQCQRMICSAVKQGATVIALDMHGTLAKDQIFKSYRGEFANYMYEIDAHKNGIPCRLFRPLEYLDESKENALDLVEALTDIIGATIHVGSTQRAELRSAINYVYENQEFAQCGFKAIDTALCQASNRTAKILREKLYPVTAHNVFVEGENFIQLSKINIVRLSRFSFKSQQMIAEMLLGYVWRMATAEKFKKNPVYIFIDECQNMPSGKDSVLAQILSEGRKFGVHLILATQMLSDSASAVQTRMTQCGLLLYFKPAANRVKMTARMIDASAEGEWCRLLRTLKVGEFIADGSFMIAGVAKSEPLKISAVVDCDKE